MTDLRSSEGINIGRVVSRTFGAIGSNFVTLFVLALVFSAIPSFAINFAAIYFGVPMVSELGGGATYTSLWAIAINLLASLPAYIAAGAITHGALVAFNSGKASLGDCIGTGLRNFLTLFLLGFATSFAIAFGFILLIVPGIILALMLCVSAPAMVAESLGVFGSMSRSAKLTENHRWAIFGLIVICAIMIMLIGMVLGVLLFAVFGMVGLGGSGDAGIFSLTTGGPASWGGTILSLAADALGTMIAAAGVASLYYELRTVKEGTSSDELAKVFD